MVADHPTESIAADPSVPVELSATATAEAVEGGAQNRPNETGSGATETVASAADEVQSDADAVAPAARADVAAADYEESVKSTVERAEYVEGQETAESGEAADDSPTKDWYILKVQVNREDTIRQALLRRIKIEGLEEQFDEIVVPTEDVVEFNKSGKRKVVRRKLYPGYILVHMAITDDTWFLIRETPGVGDFTGSAGKPTPMDPKDVERILRLGVASEEGGAQIKTSIPFKSGDRVRVKDGHFQNFEGQVDSIDEANGRITVMINIFNRSTPVELEHWQVESV